MEHLNRLANDAIQNLGANKSEEAIKLNPRIQLAWGQADKQSLASVGTLLLL